MQMHRCGILSLVIVFCVGNPVTAQVVDVNNDGTVGPHEALEVARLWKQAATAIGAGTPAWYLMGNTGTTPGTDFLGTTDDKAFEMKVNNQRVFRLEPDAISPNVIGGHRDNAVMGGANGATIGGGGGVGQENLVQGLYGTIGGGRGNIVGDTATVGGGQENRVSGQFSVVAGGIQNSATGSNSAIGGGHRNSIPFNNFSTIAGGYTNEARADSSTIGGGVFNTVAVSAFRAAVAGGGNNSATGTSSTISGGEGNGADGDYAAIGGGLSNHTMAAGATISGGTKNQALGALSTIGGGGENRTISLGSTVAGGVTNAATRDLSTVGGGGLNTAWALFSTVGGGFLNGAHALNSTVAGGSGNLASGASSVVGGGIGNAAEADNSTVSGGFLNRAENTNATVPGGANNAARGIGSFAAGTQSKANEAGTFVWADSLPLDFPSSTTNEFRVRATGGVWFVTEVAPGGGVTRAAYLPPGGTTWQQYSTIPSDRNIKQNIEQVDGVELLERLCSVEISTWNYNYQDPPVRHVGPIAQDFEEAFDLGSDGHQIDLIDANGIALAAIQGLNRKLEEKDAEIDRLKSRLAAVEAKIGAMFEHRREAQ